MTKTPKIKGILSGALQQALYQAHKEGKTLEALAEENGRTIQAVQRAIARQSQTAKESAPIGMVEQVIYIRPDVMVTIRIPTDLTGSEALRLSEIVKNFYMGIEEAR